MVQNALPLAVLLGHVHSAVDVGLVLHASEKVSRDGGALENLDFGLKFDGNFRAGTSAVRSIQSQCKILLPKILIFVETSYRVNVGHRLRIGVGLEVGCAPTANLREEVACLHVPAHVQEHKRNQHAHT